jgi:hypothetical protein
MLRRERPDRDQSYVEDILDSAQASALYVAQQTAESFSANRMLVYAVLRRLSIIGMRGLSVPGVQDLACASRVEGDRRASQSPRAPLLDIGDEKIWTYPTVDVPEFAAYLSQQ